jgi:lipopolysaccharide/colanic/teichoic acid biosynthesis glycosyltransferase
MNELENDMLRSPILKRAIDVAGSLVGLLVGAPFLLIGAGLVPGAVITHKYRGSVVALFDK